MAGLNLTNILYLSYRLGPFILVSSLVLQSILNWDLRGIVYLMGLIFAFGGNVFANKSFPATEEREPNAKCGIISLGEKGDIYSNFPLSLTVYGYTLTYMMSFILSVSPISTGFMQNIPSLVLFTVLIILETFWVVTNKCSSHPLYVLGALLVGAGFGFAWGFFVVYLNKPNLTFINRGNLDVCSRPRKTYFKCSPTN
jgi:hypothetical protein